MEWTPSQETILSPRLWETWKRASLVQDCRALSHHPPVPFLNFPPLRPAWDEESGLFSTKDTWGIQG